MKPYKNKGNTRTFSKNTNKLELVWHKDKEDRNIEILEGKDWKMQFDNELPFELTEGDRIFITKHRIHRIHKGTTDLKKYLAEGRLFENQDDSFYIDEIKRDLEELDVKEGNKYLEDLAKSILKLKR
jgi:hypothetical protein